jgi:uncharacterized RDD family membrane protein YckC
MSDTYPPDPGPPPGSSPPWGQPSGYPPPPPPPGYQPPGYPPPPPGYATQPSTGGYQYGGPPQPNSAGALATWGQRAQGYLVDWGAFIIIGFIADVANSGALKTLIALINLAAFIFLSIQLGQTGQTPGMRVIGLKCVNKNTGQPIGGGLGFVRALAHLVDSIICLIGWLFPLWDSQRQTIADKIMGTVVVVVPKQPFSITAPRP